MTRKEHEADILQREVKFQKELKEKQENLALIKEGYAFGVPDVYFFDDSYHPCVLVKVISEEDCIIEAYEPCTDKTHITDTGGFIIDKKHKLHEEGK